MAISVSNKIAFLYDTFQKHMHSYTTKWQNIYAMRVTNLDIAVSLSQSTTHETITDGTVCLCVFVSTVSLQSRDRIGTGGPVVDCSRLFDNDLPDGYVK